MRDINWYVDLARKKIDDDKELLTMYEALEKMVRPEWSGDFSGMDDVMSVINTQPSDAINSGAIAFSGSKPIISISPTASNVLEYDRVEMIEDNLMWHLLKSNKSGLGTAFFDMAWSSLLYNGIAVQTFDLAHILPKDPRKWTLRQRRSWRNGRFQFNVRNFKQMHWEESGNDVTTVIFAQNVPVSDVIGHWELYAGNTTDEARQALAGLEKLKDQLGEKAGAKGIEAFSRDMNMMMFHVTTDDKICVFGHLTDSDEVEDMPNPEIIFADQKNRYEFSNWSLRIAGSRLESKPEHRVNPLLAPLYWSKSWEKLNLASSLVFSEPIRRARESRGVSQTYDGKPPIIDRLNGNTIGMRVGESYSPINALTADPQGLNIIGMLESVLNRVTGASVLGDTTKISADTPYATYSAMIKVALSRLDRQRGIMADSIGDMCLQMLDWAKLTQKPLTSYADSSKQSRGTGKVIGVGAPNVITPEMYDTSALFIKVKVNPMTPTDESEQIASAIQLSTQLNIPKSVVLEEKLGYENIPMLRELAKKEALEEADIQAEIQRKMGQVEIELAQQAQGGADPNSMVPPGQPGGNNNPTGEGGGISQAAFGQMGGDEFNPALGGQSPLGFEGGMGRIQMNAGRSDMEAPI